MTDSKTYRNVAKMITGIATSDGAGVALTRIIGQPNLPRLDPFLMLDFFGSENPGEYIAGFPEHPHRGFQTVTYMLAGKMRHKDSVGNNGLIEAGGIQWMNAEKGIIHEEMPEQEEGLLKGFQLWVNLPASEKLSAPNYQDITPDLVPTVKVEDAEVKVLAGEVGGAIGPVKTTAVAPTFLDVTLSGDASVDITDGDSAFIYVYEGDVAILDSSGGRQPVKCGQLAVFTQQGNAARISSRNEAHKKPNDISKFILVSGKPINEPVVQYGPFVMNTQQEIVQAFNDYQNGVLTN